MATIKERRMTDRKRLKKWREQQTAQGKRTISATISAEAYDILQTIKDETQESNSAVVERLILAVVKAQE